MSSFFLKPATKSRKRTVNKDGESSGVRGGSRGRASKSMKRDEDEEIESDDSDLEARPDAGYESNNDDDDDNHLGQETAEQKRIRLAKAYLQEIEKEERERSQSADVHDALNARLRREDLEDRGKLRESLAHHYSDQSIESVKLLKGHRLPLTCVVVTHDGHYCFSGSKDACIIKYDVTNLKRVGRTELARKKESRGHRSVINALAVSSDDHFLASGDEERQICIWQVSDLQLLHIFKGHRDSVTGLAFRKRTHTLYSVGADRAVKVWNLDEMAYVETLFGHQDRITAIDAGLKERAITAGGRDGTVRLWKIDEESQLVFNGPQCSIDAISMINEENFVSAGEQGHLSLWGVMKKKPLCTVKRAHGIDEENQEPNWISAIAAKTMSDLFASGSNDGFVRLWRCAPNFLRLDEIARVPLVGFVNGLAFTPQGDHVVVALGQEHRLGRWWNIKKAKNALAIVKLKRMESEATT